MTKGKSSQSLKNPLNYKTEAQQKNGRKGRGTLTEKEINMTLKTKTSPQKNFQIHTKQRSDMSAHRNISYFQQHMANLFVSTNPFQDYFKASFRQHIISYVNTFNRYFLKIKPLHIIATPNKINSNSLMSSNKKCSNLSNCLKGCLPTVYFDSGPKYQSMHLADMSLSLFECHCPLFCPSSCHLSCKISHFEFY